MGIHVFPHDCKDFSNNGLCGDLQPIEAYFEEEKNGISQIELTLQYDEFGKWKEVKVGRYIRAMVPVRVTPIIENDSYSTTVQKIKIKSGTKQTYLTKQMDVVYLLKKPDEETGLYYEKATNLSPDSIVVAGAVAAGIAEIRTENVRTYIYVDDYDYIETVEIPAALDGVESVTGTARLKPQFFIITSVEQTLDGMIVTAKHVFYELLHNATTYKTENKVQGAAACRQVFDNLVSEDKRFEIFSDCTDEQKGLDYDRISPVQALLDPDEGICAKYGLSLIRDNYSIYALKNVGTDRGFVVEYGKNMLSVDCIENIDETYTRIVPFGKDSKGNVVYMDGQIWIDSERIHDYPAPRVLMLDCTDTASVGKDMTLAQVKAELKRRAEEELANGIDKPDLEMTVDFLSMGDTEEYKQYRNLDKVYMFDRITVKDKVRGYDYTAEVVSVRHNLLTGMLESRAIGSLEKASAARKIASWQVPTVDGGNIR
ncbi:MAG: phage tail protein, partial [Oscillospiraceae bacterium]|nr:phage tail protein [Oscillospiraceae bacterium]